MKCTKHPLSNFVFYEKLSPSLCAFTSQLFGMDIPKNVLEWKEVVLEEMGALEKKIRLGKVVNLLEGKSTIGCKWIFTVKYNSSGLLERYKALLVAKGFTQTYGIDY